MKVRLSFLVISAAVCAAQFAPLAPAQNPPEKQNRHLAGARGGRWASLSNDERSKLRAAHQRAMQDPQVQAAQARMKQVRRDFRAVMRPAMLKADPSVQPILEKLRAQRVDERDQ